ncbi:quinone-dependent dihydroorotate dehydrogenase [soil metagenome]
MNNLYHFLRPLLFTLDPEFAHSVTLKSLRVANQLNLIANKLSAHPRTVMGITFPNPVGLAAGLDKNADYIDALAALGFGFIEVGTITPKPQSGNPKPRLFRLPKSEALINRMGFNNKGLEHLIKQLQTTAYRGILGINIGKNATTPLEKASDDYLACLRAVYNYASYITVNLSSPNTPGLRELQFGDYLRELLTTLKAAQADLTSQYGKYVPLLVKIAPDLTEEQLNLIANTFCECAIDGVIATNTTVSRVGVEGLSHADETGGLSGKPLHKQSVQVVHTLATALAGRIPIIGVGGISSAKDANNMINAGASLLQIYSGFIYRGPSLIREMVEGMPSLNE